ncbi:MAG: glycogen synthase GlgA [Candidatus Omnitrophota bacterium]
MNILFASSEVVPFAKTGGLADVLGALPESLSKKGCKCNVILPLYRCVREHGYSPKIFKKGLIVKIDNKELPFDLSMLEQGNVRVYFVERDDYYDREYLYNSPTEDYPDNALRFGFFAKAIIASIPHIGKIDLLHLNDWQTALVPFYIKLFHKDDQSLNRIKILFTIHNMAYQGLFDKKFLGPLEIPESKFTPDTLEFWGRINFMKAGIIYSDAVSTVSVGYSREILTEEFGCGLDGLLNTKKDDLFGIVNGVDYSVWNPEADDSIIKKYNIDTIGGKKDCKADLLKEFNMEQNIDRPLIGMITRLAEQKGIDLVAGSMEEILDLGFSFIILGFGEEKYNSMFKALSNKHKGLVGARIGFDNALAHKIEAGSDIFLMPSRYEPCGLNQLYSMKYGTVPVVRAVGGLDDTVESFDAATKKGNGFKFKEASGEALIKTLKNTITIYDDKKIWERLLKNCLLCDYSWDASALKYKGLYEKIVDRS